jgi:beta-phosphoglucomutase-like phosphatase (HAD superfamily)/dTDP-glucose pyrophosphorylase
MIKAIFFDLDGVLFDGKVFHRDLFLMTIAQFGISGVDENFHEKYLEGLSTKQKIDILIQKGLLSPLRKMDFFDIKQNLTEIALCGKQKPNEYIISILQILKEKGYRLICVSNSITGTVEKSLYLTGILDLFDALYGNESCANPKPSPDPYLNAFKIEGVDPSEVLILEDSIYGRMAAYASRAHVLPIVDPMDVTLDKILKAIHQVNEGHMSEEKKTLHVVVPMAGLGSRFSKAGYTVPKPFIPVFGKPMIQWVIDNMKVHPEIYGGITVASRWALKFHFIVQQAHLDAYNFDALCKSCDIEYTITPITSVTEGAACSVLLAKEHINNGEPLVIVNSDQFLEWDQNEFYRALCNAEYDGCISVFEQNNSEDIKWSYSMTDSKGVVTEVAEKKYISNWATTGIYGWNRGSDYVRYAEKMIAKNIRVNGEFYVCPVYNEAIGAGGIFRNLVCKKIWGLGVPEDLEIFLKNYPHGTEAKDS